MDVYVLLDVLLVILIALFVPIGFWRGAYREAFVTLGILFGAALGRFWGETWGMELAAVSRLHESGGAFMIAMLSLISATFLLGYSSGAAVPLPSPGWMARTLGAVIAGANGALLLSFALRDIRVYLLSSEEAGFLDSAVIAPFLSEGTGWILLVAAAIFVPISLVLALFGPDVEEEEFFDEEDEEFELYEDEEYPEPYAQQTRQIDQRHPPFSRQKLPAPRAPAARPAPAEETRPIQRVEPSDQTPSGAETQPAPPRQRVHYPQQQAPPPPPQPEPETQSEPEPEVRPQPEPEVQQRAQSEPETQPTPEPEVVKQQPQPEPDAQPRPEPEAKPQPAQTGAETRRPESRPAVDETQPHRPQFGPQPPPEPPRPEPEVEEPVYGTQTVEPPSGPQHSSEPQGVFGYIPTPEKQTIRTGTDEFPVTVCPKCQADLGGASEVCPSCGHPLIAKG